jgi:DNA-binding transcriptional LysR family regulator
MARGHVRPEVHAGCSCGSVFRCRPSLQVDHATVSRRIGALEKSLGARLFDRQTTGCMLTAAGDRLYISAEEIESMLLRALGDLSQSDVEHSGTVRVATSDGFTTLFLPHGSTNGKT